MNEAEVRGYQVALKEERIQLVLQITARDALPTEGELQKIAHLQAAIDAFQAVLDGESPGDVYKHRDLRS